MQKILMWKLGQLMISNDDRLLLDNFAIFFYSNFLFRGEKKKTLNVYVKNELKKWSRRASNFRELWHKFLRRCVGKKRDKNRCFIVGSIKSGSSESQPSLPLRLLKLYFKPRGDENETFRTTSDWKMYHKFDARSLNDWIHLSTNKN